MELSNLRTLSKILDFDEEYLINENFDWKEGKGSFIALTRKNNELSLWMLVDEVEFANHLSNRNSIVKKEENDILTERELIIGSDLKDNLISCIQSFRIQDKVLEVNSMSGYVLSELNYESYFLLLYFMRRGASYGKLEEKSCDAMQLAQFIFKGEYVKIPFEKTKPAYVKIMPCKRNRKVLAGKKFNITVGDYKDKKIDLLDELTGEKYTCYINRVGLYDPWSEEEMKKFDTAEYKEKFTDKELEQMKQQYFSLMERNCPKGKKFAYVEYEAEDNIILDLHTREFLDKKAAVKSTASVLLFFAKPEKSTGSHGIKLKVCMLETVDKDIKEIPIEMLWFYINEEIEGISFDN